MAPAKELARGIGDGRSKSYHRRGVWAVKKKNGGKLPVHPKKAAAPAKAEKVSRRGRRRAGWTGVECVSRPTRRW